MWQFLSLIISNTTTVFFLLLTSLIIIWLLSFRFVFTRQHISAFFRGLGVGAAKTKRTFIELKRKSFHLAGILIPMIYFLGLRYTPWLMTHSIASWLLGLLTVFLWMIEVARYVSPEFRRLYNIVFGSMLRKSETKENSKAFTGTGFFFLGNFLCVYLFQPTVAICSALFLVLGDMTAAIIGISFGRIKIGKKSLEGTLAMFAMCFLVGSILFWQVDLSEYVVLIGAATAAIVELVAPTWVDDNLSIPLCSGAAMTLAFRRIGIEPPPP